MRKINRSDKNNPDPYEDMLRIDKLDPYEALINSNMILKQNNKSNKQEDF